MVIVCCLAFQLGSIDCLGLTVKKLSSGYHPRPSLASKAMDAAGTYTVTFLDYQEIHK